MKTRIKIITEKEIEGFNTANAAMKYLHKVKLKALSISLNNEPIAFRDLAELYQLELAERRHNRAQGVI